MANGNLQQQNHSARHPRPCRNGCRIQPLDGENGQAVVFVLAFLGIIMLSMVFLFKSGRLTTEKMQLQNGADSAAYNASTLEARAMNFTAYTNRAMVANEVAIGQMVGLLSWADEITAIGETFEVLGGALDATVVLAEAGAALNTVGAGLIEAGEAMSKTLLAVAPIITRGISSINLVYSASQEIYHLTTILLVTNTIFQSLEDNVPGTPGDAFLKRLFTPGDTGARLSPLGLIALAGHLPSYVNGFSRRYALKDSGSSQESLAGMGRLAATVREGRDPFSNGDTTLKKGIRQDRAWSLDGSATAGIDIRIFRLTGTLTFGIKSDGGAEIRYKNDNYIWSAVDAASFTESIDLKFKAPVGRAHHKHISLPSLPLAGGAYQAGTSKQSLNAADMPVGLRRYGSPPAYGRAADHSAGWLEAAARITENRVPNTPYTNLHGYRDTVPGKEDDRSIFPFASPFFLIGVIRPLNDIEKQGPKIADPLNLPPATETDGVLGAIAKAEVYHCRPEDLAYFRRTRDDKIEKANLFSPFWQARLVKTSNVDRFLSLSLQQKIIWLNNQVADDVPELSNIIKSLRSLLGKLL
jgi:hypothetical protein